MAAASEVASARCPGRSDFMLRKTTPQAKRVTCFTRVHELASNSFVAISNDVGEKLMKLGLQTQLVTAHFASTANILAWNMRGRFLCLQTCRVRRAGFGATIVDRARCELFPISPFRQERYAHEQKHMTMASSCHSSVRFCASSHLMVCCCSTR